MATEISQGKYLYCVIRTASPVGFNFQGVSGAEEWVHSIHCGDLAVVASNSEGDSYRLTRSTAVAHQLVIQEVMRGFTVLPFSFGTRVNTEEAVRELLGRYQEELVGQLQYLEGKTEYSLKALWRDKEQPFREILAEREDIRRYRDAVAKSLPAKTHQERIEVGRMVRDALESKRAGEAQRILERLQPLTVDARMNPVYLDEMLLNAAFLLTKGSETTFEEELRVLDREYRDRVRFRLAGPVPPFNFVRIPVA